jgi:hypothetical protein
MNALRLCSIALLCGTTFYLNACGNKSQAKPRPASPTASTPSKPAASADNSFDGQCTALDQKSFMAQAALDGVEMTLKMGSTSLIEMPIERADRAISEVKALQITDPKVKALQTEYLRLAEDAFKLARPLTKASEAQLQAAAPTVKAKSEVAAKFRKDKIFFGDCK